MRILSKLRKEAMRPLRQLGRVHWYLFAPLRRGWHDLRKRGQIRLTPGQVAAGQDMALVLIYQPEALSESLLETLAHLCGRGFAPLVVSNAPLDSPARARLAPLCHQILERPNFGYDFGGYRDGILHLLAQGREMRHLLVLNDSVWFPVSGESDLLDEARSSGADLYGYALSNRDKRREGTYVDSYFMMFGPKVLASGWFARYWRRFLLSDDKRVVIRNGEMQLAQRMRDQGFTVRARYSFDDVLDGFSRLPLAELPGALAFQAGVSRHNARLFANLLEPGPRDGAWRDAVLARIAQNRVYGSVRMAPAEILFGLLGVPILKKNAMAGHLAQRRALLRLGLEAGFTASVQAELRQRTPPDMP